jgi:hypothetical protein
MLRVRKNRLTTIGQGDGSTVVEHSTHHSKVEGSIPAAADATMRKMVPQHFIDRHYLYQARFRLLNNILSTGEHAYTDTHTMA